MILVDELNKINKKLLILIFILLLIFTIIYMGRGGIYGPIKNNDFAQIKEEALPLAKFLEGEEFISDNPRQYGPFFILIINTFMLITKDDFFLSKLLLLFTYLLTALAFYISYKSIFQGKPHKKFAYWVLFFVWFNFAPLFYIILTKNVEIWELFLISFAFMMFIKRKYFWTGFSFAAGLLIKFLPGLFIIYFFFKNKKVFIYSLLGIAIIILAGHFVYGPQMGLLYLFFLIMNSLKSQTWAVMWHENTALKGFIYKLFGGFNAGPEGIFLINSNLEKLAFLTATILQILLLIYLIFTALRKNCSKEENMIQFSLISVMLLILSPISSVDYSVLLLFAYSVGVYFILYKNLKLYMHVLFWSSYIILGKFALLGKLIPFEKINILLGNEELTQLGNVSYGAYGIPLLGFILLGLFFILLWHKKGIINK